MRSNATYFNVQLIGIGRTHKYDQTTEKNLNRPRLFPCVLASRIRCGNRLAAAAAVKRLIVHHRPRSRTEPKKEKDQQQQRSESERNETAYNIC